MEKSRLPPLPLIALVIAVIVISVISGVFDMVVLGSSIAVVSIPLHHFLSKAVRPWVSAGVITVTLLAGMAAGVLMTLTLLSENSALMSEVIRKISEWVSTSGSGPDLFGLPVGREQVTGWLAAVESLFSQYWLGVANEVPLIARKVLVFFSVLFTLILYGERIWEWITRQVPGSGSPVAHRLTSVSVDTLYALYVVHVLIAGVTFFISIPFFWVLGYGHVLYFSFVCAVCELIPVLGSSVVMVFIGAYAVALGDIRGVIITFILGYIGVAVLPEIFLRPVLMGRRVHIHPVIMFIGFIGGIILLGSAGFVLGPLALVLLTTWLRIRHNTPAPGPGAAA